LFVYSNAHGKILVNCETFDHNMVTIDRYYFQLAILSYIVLVVSVDCNNIYFT